MRDGHNHASSTLNGKYLYAINVYPATGSLTSVRLPADDWRCGSSSALLRAPSTPWKTGLRVEGYTPSINEIIVQV
jgi:hypothetical protein